MLTINEMEFFDKVYGCWAGKNIGGTLGAPFEGKKEINNVTFYTRDQNGSPAPNDDLDLQLVWFKVLKDKGCNRITPQLLGEYWLSFITGPWNEYGQAKANMRAGLLPPLSGSCNNDRWKYSNGAWIRSEVWACVAPGCPDLAIEYAYADACVDHCGDGIYAEMFTAAMESAAFVVHEIDKLIHIGLSKIPENCRIARSVKLALDYYNSGKTWQEAREAIVEDSKDLGWFQAPANIGFTVIALLYGEGDFGKTVCTAVNCGDDTDCSAATAGAILGIIMGYKNIPEQWIKPIGDSIVTVAIMPMSDRPWTTREFTEWLMPLTRMSLEFHKCGIAINDKATHIDAEFIHKLTDNRKAAEIWSRSPYAVNFDFNAIKATLNYEDTPYVREGTPFKLSLQIDNQFLQGNWVTVKWTLPEGWSTDSACESMFFLPVGRTTETVVINVVPNKVTTAFVKNAQVAIEVENSLCHAAIPLVFIAAPVDGATP